MFINENCVGKFTKYLKANGCQRVTLLERRNIPYEYEGFKKTLKDIYTINFINKNNRRITLFIHVSGLENIYLIKTTDEKKYFRKSHIINNDKQIKKIIDDYRENPSLEGLFEVEEPFDKDAREFISSYEGNNPEVSFYYFEVLHYPNLEPWKMIPGRSVVFDCEKHIIDIILPYINDLKY